MGRVGSCFDNSAAEAFFSTLEWEVLSRNEFETTTEAATAVMDWCWNFYNTTRRHSSAAMMSPIAYETAAMLARKAFDNPSDFVVASGENYPDGVVAGAYAANLDAPLLLTTSASLRKVTADYLSEKVDNGERVVVFGGPGSIAPSVSQEIAAAFNY